MKIQPLNQPRKFVPLSNQDGQVSIFLGISLIIVITFLAFIVNVGLFVKAKINLQNSIDAAAYAGASVQARQLTDIAYLNWELRNTYKEWMFKYYILGQKGMSATFRNNINTGLNPGGKMNFRLRPFYEEGKRGYDPDAIDKYNVPSICVHYGSARNICEILRIPGLPRFTSAGLPGVSEILESTINSIVRTKSENCSARSSVNMGAAMLWAYGTGSGTLFQDVPLVAANRVGAWVEAVELAIRARNLEHFVNTPPQDAPLCLGGQGCISIRSFQNASAPVYERSVKAFWSAFRNLSGGTEKGRGQDFASTFRLTELSPNPISVNANSLSGFLIPQSSGALTKRYLDLQLNPVNLATFYTNFISMTGSFRDTDVAQEADCGGVKTALPVPGYIMGFTKNPNILTYYAVKGEANFTGLFNPFNPSGIQLTAYAAAKPFGGRLGPQLFKIGPDGQSLFARETSNKQYTANYLSTITDISDLTSASTAINPGYPLPMDQGFWARPAGANTSLGGVPEGGAEVFFSIPNIIYDFENTSDLDLSPPAGRNINSLKPAGSKGEAYDGGEIIGNSGLYSARQFKLFEDTQTAGPNAIMTPDEVYSSLNEVRKPTRYDAINYLVPIVNPANPQNPLGTSSHTTLNSLGPYSDDVSGESYLYKIYAPLYGNQTLYDNPAAIIDVINEYIRSNSDAVDKYTAALKLVSDQMRVESANADDSSAYLDAAKTIYDTNPALVLDGQNSNCDKLSMAQKFATFYSTGAGGCDITPLGRNLEEYFNQGRPDRGPYREIFANYHVGIYTPNAEVPGLNFLSAYHPGERQGVQGKQTGLPFGNNQENVKRNSYSTKLFNLERIIDGSTNPIDGGQFIFMEGSSGQTFAPSSDISSQVLNKLNPFQVSEFGSPLFF